MKKPTSNEKWQKTMDEERITISIMMAVILFIATCSIVYTLEIPLLEFIIIFGLGVMVGAFLEHAYKK